jgi:opacity protein-like surface antigen
MRWKTSGVVLAVIVALAVPAHAQDAGKGFLFGRPDWSLSLRGGFSHANASSDVFSDVTDRLTLNRGYFGDFDGLTLGSDLAYSLRPDLDLMLSVSYSGTSKRSEYRRFVDNNDLPIEQTTSFSRVPVTASLKWYLTPRGRSVGRFAWIPSKYTPYVGAGAGFVWYNFEQNGDFVDFNTPNNNVFAHDFVSSSWAKTAHLLAGLDYSLSPRWSLTTEGRYSWAKTDLQEEFSGFKPIDLSGFTTTIGLYIRF